MKLWTWLLTAGVGILIWLIPAPEGIDIKAWHLFAIFAATIVGIIAKPLPMGSIAILGIMLTSLTGSLSITESLSGFSNDVIWLIVVAFFISRGFIKTGLGSRIAYMFIAALGKKSLGLAYGLIATDFVLSPAIPSNTARAGGIIFPILRSIAKSYGSEPDDGTARRIGAFLTKTSFQGTVITGAMFLTAMAANPLAAKLARDVGVDISWGNWALAAIVPGLVSLIVIPWFLYMIYPPEIKETPLSAQIARNKLKEMGQLSRSEWVMLGVFILLLCLWIFGAQLGVHNTTAALIGLGVLLVFGALDWNDVLQEKGAWDTLVWFAALMMMASNMNKLGLIPWFVKTISASVVGAHWIAAFLILSLVYFYSHYFFASNTAHVGSMYGAFLGISMTMGAPPMLAALVLAFFSNLFSSMTHYGTGPAPVFFGSGYVEMGKWWQLGGLVSIINVIIWMVIGGLWWKVLGLW